MKVGVISDTHSILRENVINKLKEGQLIIHAGDICNDFILEKLKK